jgi:hypothetical protein
MGHVLQAHVSTDTDATLLAMVTILFAVSKELLSRESVYQAPRGALCKSAEIQGCEEQVCELSALLPTALLAGL